MSKSIYEKAKSEAENLVLRYIAGEMQEKQLKILSERS